MASWCRWAGHEHGSPLFGLFAVACGMVRDAMEDEGAPSAALGTRVQARFAAMDLDVDNPKLRGQPARPSAAPRKDNRFG